MLWGVFCTSSWTWCIGMFLPFILLRLWGWPGFWAFFIPNVIGCAAFGFVLKRERSQRLMQDLAWMMALFSAFTVAYQCFFAGWAAQYFFVREGAMTTVVSTGVPIAMLVVGAWLALRRDAHWLALGAAAFAATLAVIAVGSTSVGPPMTVGAETSLPVRAPLVSLDRMWWAVPTIAFGFLLCPYLDLTFHRALQRAPRPHVAFATFGATFGAMLLAVASLYDQVLGVPRPEIVLAIVWGVQLTFTVGVHLRELFQVLPKTDMAVWIPGGLLALGVLFATPAFTFTLGPTLADSAPPLFGESRHVLLPGEPVYLACLGAYGLLFPAVVWLHERLAARAALITVMCIGVPSYLLGAWDFATYLMPLPVAVAIFWPNKRRALQV